MKRLESIGRAGVAALIALGAVTMVVPFLDMILGALRTPAEMVSVPPAFLPRTPQWGNFLKVARIIPLGRYYLNSLLVASAVTLLVLCTSLLSGFALAKYRFRGREIIFRGILATIMFPQFIFLIPVYYLLKRVPLAGGNDLLGLGGSGLLHSYAALILPFAVSGFGIFLMRQFIMDVPDDLLDAARIDGCSEFRLLWQIVLPNVGPALATVAIFSFLAQWNEFVWPMIITTSAREMMTLPVGIQLLRGGIRDLPEVDALIRAALTLAVIPVMALFVLLQRYYVRGITMMGLKG